MRANNRPFILGLTGGIATGKSAVAEHMRKLGAVIVDADEISHALTAPGGAALEEIRRVFGPEVFGPDGALDRRALGDIVFGDAASRRALEGIIHPAVQREMLRQVDIAAQEGARVAVLNVPLLFECGMDALCDEVWVTTLDKESQILRLMNRDQLTRAQALERIQSQMDEPERARRAAHVINTGRPAAETGQAVAQAYKELLRRLPPREDE